MSWHENRHTRWFKTIAIAVVCLFAINNISWANPDIFERKSNTSCLQVPSNINHILNPKMLHEMGIKFYTLGILESLERKDAFKLKLTLPGADGQFIVLDFKNKKYDQKTDKWIIPCSVVDEAGKTACRYNAVVSTDARTKKKSITLEKP
ncbi:MAG: hypothetical protein ACE5JK_03530, partial [Candidatus Omnitrophota bacterium]